MYFTYVRDATRTHINTDLDSNNLFCTNYAKYNG